MRNTPCRVSTVLSLGVLAGFAAPAESPAAIADDDTGHSVDERTGSKPVGFVAGGVVPRWALETGR